MYALGTLHWATAFCMCHCRRLPYLTWMRYKKCLFACWDMCAVFVYAKKMLDSGHQPCFDACDIARNVCYVLPTCCALQDVDRLCCAGACAAMCFGILIYKINIQDFTCDFLVVHFVNVCSVGQHGLRQLLEHTLQCSKIVLTLILRDSSRIHLKKRQFLTKRKDPVFNICKEKTIKTTKKN